MNTRREFLRGALGWGGLMLAGSRQLAASREVEPRRRALDFLAARQSADGAWRSERYAAFRDGGALTPVILWAWPASPSLDSGENYARGLRWLERLTDAQATSAEPWIGLQYPLFTASYAAQVLARAGDERRANWWAGVIERLRIRPALGWPEGDVACGAWSDSPTPPRFVAPVPDMLAPNISATVLALQGLAAARSGDLGAARPFVEQCQNFAESPTPLDDGGFFFATGDPIRNKAGVAGHDARGQTRYRSYGSATCDGLLALQACGVPDDHPRCRAAREWLRTHADGLLHAGDWAKGREAARAALVFYFAQGLATVLAGAPEESWTAACRRSLHEALGASQMPDGSWQGHAPESCEDEPLLATAFALRALASRAPQQAS